MPRSKSIEKRTNQPRFRLECPICTDETASPNAPSHYRITDVGEEASFNYEGNTIPISVSTLIDIKILGAGNFGNVMLCEVKNHEKIQMAVKRLNLVPSRNNPDSFTSHTDLRTMRTVGSGENSHVTRFYTALTDNDKRQLLICMEVCQTSMEKFYEAMHKINATEHLDLLLKRMTSHIVDALQYLKSKKILHRDVKPSNILIHQGPVIFKLCDFGISSEMIDSVAHTMTKGTQIYLAPERIDKTISPYGYGIRSDMWALGLSVFEIAANKPPFLNMRSTEILNKVQTSTLEPPKNISQELQDLIVHLLKFNQEDRPENYQKILDSSALKSLPDKITAEETEMVKNVIPNIPEFPE